MSALALALPSARFARPMPHSLPSRPDQPSDQDFERFRTLLLERTGISLGPNKKPMLASRLSGRVRDLRLGNFGAYFERVRLDPSECQTAIDLLTTNETWFFREKAHFDFIADTVLPQHPAGQPFRVWSAASSTGEEAYSLAMLLADRFGPGGRWEVFASDISTRVLEHARGGIYPLQRIDGIPPDYLRRFCLRGQGAAEGKLAIDTSLRQRVRFEQVNLMETPPPLGSFDVIFLRNAMIYFDLPTKRQVVARLLPLLKPGGHFIVSLTESLNGLTDALQPVRASVYRKPPR